MELSEYALHRLPFPRPVLIPAATPAVSHLAFLESTIATHRLLRGVQIFLFFFCITLVNFEFDSPLGNNIVHGFLTLLSVAGVVCVYKVYQCQAVFTGIASLPASIPAGANQEKHSNDNNMETAAQISARASWEDPPHGREGGSAGTCSGSATPSTQLPSHSHTSGTCLQERWKQQPPPQQYPVRHAPLLSGMLLEMFLWLLHAPPGFPFHRLGAALDAAVMLRVYVVVLYPSERWSLRYFARAVEAVTSESSRTAALGFRNRLSRSLHAERWWWRSIGALLFVGLTAVYRQAEQTTLLDAGYFCAATAALMGFGNVSPTTFTGRVVAMAVWGVGLLLIVLAIRFWAEALSLSPSSRTLYSVLQLQRLSAHLPETAAVTIQRAWRWRTARSQCRCGGSRLRRECAALLFSRQCLAFRQRRRLVQSIRRPFHPDAPRGLDATAGRTAVLRDGRTRRETVKHSDADDTSSAVRVSAGQREQRTTKEKGYENASLAPEAKEEEIARRLAHRMRAMDERMSALVCRLQRAHEERKVRRA